MQNFESKQAMLPFWHAHRAIISLAQQLRRATGTLLALRPMPRSKPQSRLPRPSQPTACGDGRMGASDPLIHGFAKWKKSMPLLRTVLVSLVALWAVGSACAKQPGPSDMRLCGWFVNPTPANAWLVDRHAKWSIGIQGGAEAEGDWPPFKPSQWVKTNGSYGYGCACMRVVADPHTHQVTSIKSAQARSLAMCRRDRFLKTPS